MVLPLPLPHAVLVLGFSTAAALGFWGVRIAYIGIGNGVPAAMESTCGDNGTSSSSIESSHACSSSGDSESGYMRVYRQSIVQNLDDNETQTG